MKLSSWLLVGVVLGAFAVAAPAQRMQLGDGSGREVVVVDVGDLVDFAGRDQGPDLKLPDSAKLLAEPLEAWTVSRLASLARVAAGSDSAKGELQPLGERHLVALGDAQWIGGVEGFLRDARANAKVQFFVEVTVFEVDDASKVWEFTGPKVVVPNPRSGEAEADGAAASDAMFVLDGDAAAKFAEAVAAARANALGTPRLIVHNLRLASMAHEEQITYVRDFTVRKEAGVSIAEPVIDTVLAGTRIETVCCLDKQGKVLVDLTFRNQVVDRPLAEFKTKLGATGQEVTIQLPQVIGCKASLKLLMTPGSTVVVPCKRDAKRDGRVLLVMAKVQRVDQEAKPR